MKKIIALLLVIVSVFSFVGCKKDTDGREVSDGVKLNRSVVTVSPDQIEQLYVHGTDKEISWSSSDESVVIVDGNGLLKAIAIGTATVTAKVGGKNYDCEINVVGEAYIPVLKLSCESLNIYSGQTFTPSAVVKSGTKTVDTPVNYKSSNENIVKIEDGVIKAIAVGEATVEASCVYNGMTASVKIPVKVLDQIAFFVKETGIRIVSTVLNQGETNEAQLSYSFKDYNEAINDYTVTWSSSDERIATVNNSGKVFAQGKGVARITATLTANGKSLNAWTDVEVYNAIVEEVKSFGSSEVQSDNTFSIPLSKLGYGGESGESVTAIINGKEFGGSINNGNVVINTDGTVYGTDDFTVEVKDRIYKLSGEIVAKYVEYKVTRSFYDLKTFSYIPDASGKVTEYIRYSEDFVKALSFYDNYVLSSENSDEIKINPDGTTELNLCFNQAIPIGNTGGKGYLYSITDKNVLGNDNVTIERKKIGGKVGAYEVTDKARRTYIKIVGIDKDYLLANNYTKLTFWLYFESNASNVVSNAYNSENTNKLFSYHMRNEIANLYPTVSVNGTASGVGDKVWSLIEINLSDVLSESNGISSMDFVIGCEGNKSFAIYDVKVA